MNQRLKNVLKFLLFLSIGIVLIWWSLHKLTEKDIQDIGSALQRAKYGWLILAMIIGLLSHLSRAIRWKMLMEPLGRNPKTSNAFFAVMIGYLTNYAVLRLGEVTRCGVLTRYEKVPFTESFGTVIVERIIDTLTFLILGVILFFIQFDTAYTYLSENFFPKISEQFMHPSTLFYIEIGCLLAPLFLFLVFRKKIMLLVGRKVKNFVLGFVEGIKAIRKVKSPALFIAHSVFIWLIYYVTFHMCFFALDETKNLSFSIGLTAFLIATLTIMFTPGGLGAYPIAMASILLFFKIDYSIGTAIGWFIWLTQFVSIILLGLLSLILLPLLNKELKPAQESV